MNSQEQYIQQLTQSITAINQQIAYFQTLDEPTLRYRPRPVTWSILDCVEHLNLFYADYFPRIEKVVRSTRLSTSSDYRPGFFGKRMIKAMLPHREERKGKIKTFKKMVPHTDQQSPYVVFNTFLDYQKQLQEWIARPELDWNRPRVASALGPILQFRLGDCFRLMVAHSQRHILQAEEQLATR